MRSSGRSFTAGIVCLMALGLLGACQRAHIDNPAVDRFPAPDQELDYLEALGNQLVVTNNDALHGLITFADGADLARDYEARVKVAREKGWVGGNWNPPASDSASVGWMAVAGCKIVQLKGGVSMRVFGPTPRYATRELVFVGVLPLRTDNQSLSGAEFVDYLNRLGRIQRYGKPVALAPSGVPEGAGAEPAGAPDQLLNESAVQMALPVVLPRPMRGTAPEPAPVP